MSTFLQKHFPKIYEINQRYSVPKVKLSKPMKVILFLLRCYLLILVLMLLYKFYATIAG